jgi:hypothetical protein
MNALVYQALREVLARCAFAQVEESPWPTAVLQKGSLQGHVQLRPPAVDACPLMPAAEVQRWVQLMWGQQQEISDLDVDVLDSLGAIWLYQARARHEALQIHLDQLLRLRGLQPKRGGQGRRGGYELEQRATILSALAHIQNLYVSIPMLPGDEHDRQGRHQRTRQPQGIQGRIFVITDAGWESSRISALSGPDCVFHPGEVLTPWLVGSRRQTAWLPVKALQYDPYRHAWAKRMARYLTWQWRIRARRGDYLSPYRVITLLETVGGSLDHRNPCRTKAHLEMTLDLLKEDGVLAAWRYVQWKEGLKGRPGWAIRWQQATILIEPSDPVREAYHRCKDH